MLHAGCSARRDSFHLPARAEELWPHRELPDRDRERLERERERLLIERERLLLERERLLDREEDLERLLRTASGDFFITCTGPDTCHLTDAPVLTATRSAAGHALQAVLSRETIM